MSDISSSVSNAIKEILLKRNIINYKLKSTNGTKKGDNNFSNLRRIEVIVEDEKACFNIICKLAPKNEARRLHMNVRSVFLRESIIYSEIIKEFYNLQNDKKNLDELDKFDSVPNCLFISIVDKDEFILLEDLKQNDYYMYDRFERPTFEHVRLAMEELANYHAMSFCLRDQRPIIFKKLINLVKRDSLFTNDMSSLIIDYPRTFFDATIRAFSEMDEDFFYLQKIIKKIEKFRDNLKSVMIKNVDGTQAEPYAVFCHGDFWNNNILYKNDSENNNPVSAKILDFQMSRYASPILDIMHYLFCCTDSKFRNEHFHDVKNVYYTALTKKINVMGSNAEKLFSRNIFDNEFKKYSTFGFCMAFFAIPYYIADAKNMPNFDVVSDAYDETLMDKDNNRASSTPSSSASSSSTSSSTSSTSTLLPSCSLIASSSCSASVLSSAAVGISVGVNLPIAGSSNILSTSLKSELPKEEEPLQKQTNGNSRRNVNDVYDQLYEVLNQRTLPIFKKRMVEIALDMEKYDLW